MYCVAESKPEMDEWMQAIKKQMTGHPPSEDNSYSSTSTSSSTSSSTGVSRNNSLMPLMPPRALSPPPGASRTPATSGYNYNSSSQSPAASVPSRNRPVVVSESSIPSVGHDASDWITYYTDDGLEYYYNETTGETSWEPPPE